MAQKSIKPAVLFGEKTVTRMGYIEGYIFACEIKGADHIIYTKPRRPKYHLVIVVIEGSITILINGERITFKKNSYINLPVWVDIYEIEYGDDFHAMVTATDKNVIEDIFQNRNPFPQDFGFTMNHSLGGKIINPKDMKTLQRDISNMIEALNDKEHRFAEEINYAYFYIMLTDMADMMWNIYGKDTPSHVSDMTRSDKVMKDFMGLLNENILTQTSVSYYAEKLCISKKYLSLIVKQKTHTNISTIMSVIRTETASRMLRDPEMSIQQIAETMSFSDQSSFGKFFKKHTGMSPLKYRQNLRKTLLTLRPAEIKYR